MEKKEIFAHPLTPAQPNNTKTNVYLYILFLKLYFWFCACYACFNNFLTFSVFF